jgi:hypothetical protein
MTSLIGSKRLVMKIEIVFIDQSRVPTSNKYRDLLSIVIYVQACVYSCVAARAETEMTCRNSKTTVCCCDS